MVNWPVVVHVYPIERYERVSKSFKTNHVRGNSVEHLKPYQTETKVNTSLEVQTCLDTRAMGGQMDWQQDASSKQFAKELKPF